MNTQHGTNSASLRPRNRRLISIEDDLQTIDAGPSTAPLSISTSSSTFASRASSPLHSAQASRSSSANRPLPKRAQTANKTSRLWNLKVPTPSTANFLFSPKYWEDSWSSIQGVATTLLGTDIRDAPRSATLPSRHGRRPSKYGYGGQAEDEWGPTINVENHLAVGSKEDRLAQVQARKRETLLTANGHTTPDAKGRHKRKSSVDTYDASPSDQSGDALVYLHEVQPNDTSAGLAIKYSCPEPVLRKANRLWPNDSIQLRKIAYLPVDACGVRGQKVESPASATPHNPLNNGNHEDPSLTPTPTSTDWSIPTTPKASTFVPYPAELSTSATSPSLSVSASSDPSQQPHIHDSWVRIDKFSSLVEIARLPRRTLGFFPPARRKSIHYHDATPPPSSPYISPALSPARNRDLDRSASPYRKSFSRTRPRASSTAAQAAFASALHGPGGVGTLGVEARGPGPAQDKLNQLVATHLPGIAPRASFESVVSSSATSNTGLENFGGRVEGWMRKMAAKGLREGGAKDGSDLIELVEGLDLGGASGDASAQGSRRGSGRLERMERAESSKGKERGASEEAALGASSDRVDEEARLRERFPIGGRVFEQKRTD